jgi:hypothetical protein
MTSIKPPSSGTSGPQALPERADAAGGSQQTDRAESSAFQQSLAEANQASQANQAAGVAGSAGAHADPVGALARSVESGAITLDQAVERLVEQTLEKAGRHLSGEQRTELTALLRSALQDDPTLAGLRS